MLATPGAELVPNLATGLLMAVCVCFERPAFRRLLVDVSSDTGLFVIGAAARHPPNDPPPLGARVD